MLSGRDVIIISIDDAKRLVAAIRFAWDKDRIQLLAEHGYLSAMQRLEDAIKRYEDPE